ncbi:hypothetical protein AXFE_01410 [Acidithrix ferrooxidans]|uniref:Uncharacterized protein n=1 Tax=Acidithrix ferrooxidans TaxID=1280514 RepID=A0A0D8HMM3_9ACTN|nr:hypothetical protein AXFE_01410 [Acidithrix ferrooxidans]
MALYCFIYRLNASLVCRREFRGDTPRCGGESVAWFVVEGFSSELPTSELT